MKNIDNMRDIIRNFIYMLNKCKCKMSNNLIKLNDARNNRSTFRIKEKKKIICSLIIIRYTNEKMY